MAILKRHFDIAEVLLAYGADINEYKSGQLPVLVNIALQNDVITSLFLINRGANVDHGNIFHFPLLIAALHGKTEMVNLLVSKGVNINQISNTGMFPLYVASKLGWTDIVGILLRAGADIDLEFNGENQFATQKMMR